MSSQGLPPQRRQAGGRSGPGANRQAGRTNLTPKDGAEEAERRLGLPCFHAGQRVKGLFGCIACQKQIRNRGVLPGCPDCGEIIWAYLETGPRPVPEGEESQPAAAPVAPAKQAATVEEGVKLQGPVSVQENVKLEP